MEGLIERDVCKALPSVNERHHAGLQAIQPLQSLLGCDSLSFGRVIVA